MSGTVVHRLVLQNDTRDAANKVVEKGDDLATTLVKDAIRKTSSALWDKTLRFFSSPQGSRQPRESSGVYLRLLP